MPIEIGTAIVIPAVVALVVGLGNNQLAIWRDRKAKRREARLSYLIKSYRTLAKASEHPQLQEISVEFQEALADIQFLGTAKQVFAAQTVVHSFLDTNKADLDPLLMLLRDELREEMGVEAMKGRRMWLRVDLKTPRKLSNHTEI